MRVIYEYNKRNKFVHKIQFYDLTHDDRAEIYAWMQESDGKYNVDYIYWGIANGPRYSKTGEIHFTENDIAMAAKLKWM